jgi:tetratricopeptide (TPR) repeat protein
MPGKLLSCVSLPPATRFTVPIYEFAKTNSNEEVATLDMEQYYTCCGKTICKGCIYSFCESGNNGKCPFCNADRSSKTREENNEDLMKRVEANDPGAIYFLADSYRHGFNGLQQDQTKAKELYTRAAGLGYIMAHNQLGGIYDEGGDLKKAKFHFEAAAMAGYDVARYNIGCMEAKSGNMERAIKHWMIAASAGHYTSMHQLRDLFEEGVLSRDEIDSSLSAFNNSCAEFRSEARDACIQIMAEASAQPQL